MYYLGIDTSAYTTSLAIVSANRLVWEERLVLKVPKGETGLAQSAAFFQHVQNLPLLVQKVPSSYWAELAGIGVSSAPRRIRGSYMPVFTAGLALARSLAAARQNGLWLTSHQEGHLAAGLASAGGPGTARFLLLHLSGGTTELIEVRRGQAGRFDLNLLGGTTDLHAGQFVDRVGVRLGLEFPAGKRLEELAEGAAPGAESLLPSSVLGLKVSFSGVESAARRLVERGVSRPDVARAVEGCLSRTVSKLVRAGCAQTGLTEVLLVGGVAANKFIRRELNRRLPRTVKLYWAEPDWSRDNAIGAALLAEQALS